MQEFFSQEPVPNIPSLTDIKFTEEDILKACAELKSSSAPGADGVPSALLKNCRQELKRPLFILWRCSLNTGIIPADLLLVLICPVHKGGSRGAAKRIQKRKEDIAILLSRAKTHLYEKQCGRMCYKLVNV